MGNKDEESPTKFTTDGWFIRKKTAYGFIIFVLASLVAVGLLTYFLGVKGPSTNGDDSGEDEKPEVETIKDVRLPRHLKPTKYDVRLLPYLIPGNFTIDGFTRIYMDCVIGGSRNITIHSVDIEIVEKSIKILDSKKRETEVVGIDFDLKREFLIIKLNQELKKGEKYELIMDFTAQLGNNLKGFYRSSYVNQETNKTEYMAVTQFQPTDARRAFPCFDEPALKAKFNIILGREKSMSSISNMPILKKGVEMNGADDYVFDQYEESVPMSTYLVAFVVSNFVNKETFTDNNSKTKFRIWARKSAIDQTKNAQQLGPKILKYFEDFFNVSYPLPKQDMIAIPDFSSGAMENWGLITYRESALLFKEKVSSIASLQKIATIISHELAHQWFGNLVTPSWWTDLWLNEGFASYVEYLGVNSARPDMKIMEQFVYTDLQHVFGIDALESSHPVSVVVHNPSEINEIFDKISYSKGASIIRMMNHFLRENTFKKGLTNYLRDLQFQAAEQDDLWAHLTKQAHKDGSLPENLTVKTIMDTWTLQMGYPVLKVTRNYDEKKITVSQERFLLNKAESKDKHDYRWWIPLTFATPGENNFDETFDKIWLEESEKSKTIDIKIPPKNVPVIFNIQETGYYRVNYDEKNWKMIISQLKKDHKKIHVINRAQIINDALNLARAGLLSYELALGITEYLEKETEYLPWASVLTDLKYLNDMLKRSPAYGSFKEYVLKLIDPLYKRLGFTPNDEDGHMDILLRSFAVRWACRFKHEDCIDNVKKNFKNWMNEEDPDDTESNPVFVDLKQNVYCNAIGEGDEKEWDFLWERYLHSNVASEKNSILSSLACTEKVWLLNRYLMWSLNSTSGIRKQDGTGVISWVAQSTIGRDLSFDFIRDQWPSIYEYYGRAAFSFSGILKNVMKNRNTEFELGELLRFQKDHRDQLGPAKRTVNQAIEEARNNIKWMETNYETIKDWLDGRS